MFEWPIALGIILGLTLASIASHKMDVLGGIIGGLIAICIYAGGGFNGLGLLMVFFVAGTMASQWKMPEKIRLGLAQDNKGTRTVRNAVANGGMAALFGLLAWAFPDNRDFFHAVLAATLASATGDTLSSELGNVYGRHFVNIVTGKRAQRGLDGVISLEGTLLGAAGSLLIALGYAWGTQLWIPAIWVAVAGICGNTADSVLGATIQRRGYLTNDAVNFANTVVASLVMMGGLMLA